MRTARSSGPRPARKPHPGPMWLWGGLAILVTLEVACFAPEPPHEVDRARVCMVEDRVRSKAGQSLSFENQTYFVHCPRCVERFHRDPQGHRFALDPVTRTMVDKASALVLAYRDQAFYFATEEARAAFRSQPLSFVVPSGQRARDAR